MKLQWSKQFAKDYQKLPDHIQKQTDQKLRLFRENEDHPSLRRKKIKGTKIDLYELSVTMNYRILFTITEDVYLLKRIGTHDILKQL